MSKHERVVIGNAELWLGDCREILPTLSKVDAVITDPPYGISYVSNYRKSGPTHALVNDDIAPTDAVVRMAELILDGGALYLATRFDVSAQWVDAIRSAGLTLKTPIYWDKGNHTSGDLEGDFGGQVEIFLFAHKGRHKLRGPRVANLWRVAREHAGDHPTPKPVMLMERMISCSTDRGQIVIDPFMGSGTTGVACMNLGRRFIGVEIERKYFDIACERIENAQRQQRLFA
jgi:site-specific DNA-methyltransferase (adenine-specific)